MQRPVWQALALQDLTHLSQGGPSERWRRAAIFDDESGDSWSTAMQHCLGEVCPSQLNAPKPTMPRVDQHTCQSYLLHEAFWALCMHTIS